MWWLITIAEGYPVPHPNSILLLLCIVTSCNSMPGTSCTIRCLRYCRTKRNGGGRAGGRIFQWGTFPVILKKHTTFVKIKHERALPAVGPCDPMVHHGSSGGCTAENISSWHLTESMTRANSRRWTPERSIITMIRAFR